MPGALHILLAIAGLWPRLRAEVPEDARVFIVSRKPLALVIPDFLSKDGTATLLGMVQKLAGLGPMSAQLTPGARWTEQENAVLLDVEERLGALTGQPAHSDEQHWLARAMMAPSKSSGKVGGATFIDRPKLDAGEFPNGFHVDTAANMVRRFVSGLLYLSSPVDGQTCFPLATTNTSGSPEEETLELSRRFVAGGIHSVGDKAQEQEVVKAAKLFMGRSRLGKGLCVQPQPGTLLVFWTRGDAGEIDPHSWHGTKLVNPNSPEPKWFVRKFKQMPKSVWNSTGCSDKNFQCTPDWPRIADYVRATRMPYMEAADRAETCSA
eukprot:CAMPEP_0170627430 /NCGR_PEP_ID=MMETSP0224-20130122/31970_1 /TAXON_ID=285029 /ORGANISM="Togula jolla, Strain CCCM 725" /LENGTH=321 /DNA_ID=CAMNT_0010954435 /DNA_START=1 /DNA_END=963 /DNA_ORIENTATION=-